MTYVILNVLFEIEYMWKKYMVLTYMRRKAAFQGCDELVFIKFMSVSMWRLPFVVDLTISAGIKFPADSSIHDDTMPDLVHCDSVLLPSKTGILNLWYAKILQVVRE